MGHALVSHADNETNENAWPRLPPVSGHAPPATAGSLEGSVAVNRKTFSVCVHEALYRAFKAFMQALSLKSLKFLQKRVLNIIFPGGEYATNLIIASIHSESRQPQLSQLFFRRSRVWGMEEGGRKGKGKWRLENREETAGKGCPMSFMY